jgi:hypothetical protein
VSELADLEIALRQDRAYAQLANSHAHRATREDSLGLIKGRDAITTVWVKEDASDITITADLNSMIAFKVKGQQQSWHGHRWVWREDGHILREIVVEDRGQTKFAPPIGCTKPGTAAPLTFMTVHGFPRSSERCPMRPSISNMRWSAIRKPPSSGASTATMTAVNACA